MIEPMPMPMVPTVYSKAHQDNASPKRPMPAGERAYQMRIFRAGLEAIERGAAPTVEDWRVCSDVVNLLETLKAMGQIADEQGLLEDAIAALAQAGERHLRGLPIRLSGEGLQAVRAIIDDYGDVLAQLPHRTVIKAHRKTAERIQQLLKTAPRGVQVLSL